MAMIAGTPNLATFSIWAKIGAAILDGLDVLGAEIVPGNAAAHLQRADGRDDHDCLRAEAGLAALDVEELLGAEIGTETGFGHDIFGQLQRGAGLHDRVTAMSDVRERAAMDEGRVVLERLHEVRLHRILEQHRHRAGGADITAIDRAAVTAIGDDHVVEPLAQILDVRCQAEDRHDFGCDRDVEPCLGRETVRDTAKRGGDLPERTVVHVDDTAPDDAALVDAELVAPVDVVVDHRGQQVVRAGDRVEVAREVQVHLVHRDDLGVTTTSGAALHAEVRAKRCLADADAGGLADGVQPVDQPDRRRRLPLARGRRVDRGDENQVPVRTVLQRGDEIRRYLGLVMAIGEQVLGRDSELGTHLLDRFLGRLMCDLDVSFHYFPSGAELLAGGYSSELGPFGCRNLAAAFGVDPICNDKATIGLHVDADFRVRNTFARRADTHRTVRVIKSYLHAVEGRPRPRL